MLQQRFFSDVRSHVLELFQHVIVMKGGKGIGFVIFLQNFQNDRHDSSFTCKVFVDIFVPKIEIR